MPGIVGLIRIDGGPVTIAAALQKLRHFPAYLSKDIQLAPGIAVGAVYRKDRAHDFDWHFDPRQRVGVLVHGTIVAADPVPHVLGASDVLREYQARGFQDWDRFEGGFVAAIIDVCRERLFLVNDRLGVLPLYYASRPGAFAFAPEAKGIFANDGFPAHLSTAGITNFLSAGYCFGDLTLFDGVQVLEPSTRLSVNLRTLAVEKDRLWKLIYAPAPELLPRRAAEDALSQAILTAHKVVLCDDPPHVTVALSGGWDSRGMLAALDQIGQQARLAQSWGLRDDLPGSDVFLARSLAEEFGVPFMFGSYSTDGFVESAARWCYLSEVTHDNFGWFAEGADGFWRLSQPSTDVVLLGDEAWGWQGYVENEMEARAAVFPPRLPPVLRKILRPTEADDADQLYSNALLNMARPCENADFNDRKDFMYLHGRVARFIFPLRYFIELSTPVRRPFLSNAVLEVVRRLPPQHRLHKNLYISTLRRHFPRAVKVPLVNANSLPDWAFDIRCKEAPRHYFLTLLDFKRLEQDPLSQLLDRSEFERLRDGFFGAEARPLSRRRSQLRTHKALLKHVLSRSRLLTRAMHALQGMPTGPASAFDILRRIALLSLLHEHLNDFTRP